MTNKIKEIMRTEHGFWWDWSNESLLLIMRDGGETRMANNFEEYIINAIMRADQPRPSVGADTLDERKGGGK